MLNARLSVLGLLLFTLSWLGFDHYRPWVNFHSEALALIALALMSAACLLHRKQLAFPRVGVWIAATALLPWIQFATGISIFAGDALLASLYLCGLLAAFIVGFTFTKVQSEGGGNALNGIMYALCIAAVFSAAIGLVQWLILTEPLGMYVVQTDPGDRAMGNLGQPNQLATLLLMGMAALTYIYERRVVGSFAFFLAIAFLTLVLVLSESRAGILGALSMAAFLFWKRGHVRRLHGGAIVAWVASFLLATALLPLATNALLLGNGREMEFTNSNGRWLIWQQVLQGTMQAPWTGYGWNQTPTAHAAGAIVYPGSLTYTNAHNVVIDLVAWNGFPLGILLSSACAYWVISRSWRAASVEAVAALCCLLPLLVHSLLEYPFAYAYFLVAGGLMVGVVEASIGTVRLLQMRSQGPWLLLGMWTLVGAYICYEYLRIEEDFRIVRFENLRIGQTPSEYEIPDVWMISHMAAMLKAARFTPTPGMTPAEIEDLRKVSQRFAYGALALRYTTALGLNGNPEGASHELQKIRGMYGEFYYAAAKDALRTLQTEKYPQLGAVAMP